MDFTQKKKIKEMKRRILVAAVLQRYNIYVRTRVDKEYANIPCPLPCHPDGENNSFNLHKPSNRWQCKNDTCAASNGLGSNEKGEKRWGDCINLVMALDRCECGPALKKLEGWFPNKNPVPLSEVRDERKGQNSTPPAHILDNNKPSDSVNLMKQVELWFSEAIVRGDQEVEAEYLKRVLKGFKGVVIQSYKNGVRKAAGLGPLPLF